MSKCSKAGKLKPKPMRKLKLISAIGLLLFALGAMAQDEQERKLIQFSGVIVSADSLKPVPFCNIIIKGKNRGTISDYYGYFSFVAQKGDTVQFSSIGFKKARFVIPDSLAGKAYSLIQTMSADTVMLAEAVVYPWPTKEQFRQAFLDLRLPDDDMVFAQRNLEQAAMKERIEAMGMDGSMNFRYAMQQRTAQLYHAGQLPPNNLLNPIAWYKFIKAWQEGAFKRKKKD